MKIDLRPPLYKLSPAEVGQQFWHVSYPRIWWDQFDHKNEVDAGFECAIDAIDTDPTAQWEAIGWASR